MSAQIQPCGQAKLGYDAANTRLVLSKDPQFSSSGTEGHPLKESATLAATFADELSAQAGLSPTLVAAASCQADTPQKDGTVTHTVGSPLTGTPASDAVMILSSSVYTDSQKPQSTVSIYGRIRNLLVACESSGLDREEADRRTRVCFDTGVSAAQVGSPLPRTTAATVVPAVAARTAVGRVALDGYDAGAPSGYAQVCVVAGEGGVRRDPDLATRLGFRPTSDQQQTFATVDLRVVPFVTVAEATARIAADGSLAAACSGPLQNPDPTFVPTFATAHGTVPTGSGGVFTTWEERYAKGTLYHVNEATRLGSVVVYVEATGGSADEARTRAKLGLATVTKQLNAG